MQIFVGADHAGYELKEKLKAGLPDFSWVDCGMNGRDSVDYPDFASLVCDRLLIHPEFQKAEQAWKTGNSDGKLAVMGLLICGSGQGMAIKANKFKDIRAALVFNSEIAQLSRAHNHAQVLCLGSRFSTYEHACEWLKIFAETSFAGDRHRQRIQKI